jgi:8-oxo-dGTP diphosphatase
MHIMKKRKSARILVIDEHDRVLLIHFIHKQKVSDRSYWATLGGEIKNGETIEQAAKRELYEEAGLRIDIANLIGPIWHNEFVFRLDNNNAVLANETFYYVRAPSSIVTSSANWTKQELEVISEFKWWSIDELRATSEIVYPEKLIKLLEKILKR